ncbi:MAG: gamma-glutamyl-gamma-aminobutyrate hydrolase family protein [Nanoarchaeota archaeon]|nr:gamma-glutamyl-gamma-aminobutyrate hydrolase family protein [Nanoarchaeota archaeon]
MNIVLLDCGIIKDPLRSRSLKIIEKVNQLGFDIKRVEVLENQRIEEDLEHITHIIISGSGLDFDSHQVGIEYVREVIIRCKILNIEVLGVCFGAQVIADVLGGEVVKQRCSEFGFEEIEVLQEDKLVENLPKKFDAFEYHFDCIKSLPSNFTLIGKSKNCIQIYKYNNFYGVQFHPEVDSMFAQKEIELIIENQLQEHVKSQDISYTLPTKIFENFLK